MQLKAYPQYQDSGLPWLGQIPHHWQLKPLCAFAKQKTVRNRADLPLLSVYRDYGVILRDSRDDNHNVKSEDLSNYKTVEPGDLVLNKMKTWQGSLGVSEHTGIVSPAYIVCQMEEGMNRRYIHSLLRSRNYITRYNQLSFGVRVDQWDMRFSDFRRVPVLIPPRDEQDLIVRFLRVQDARFSRLIGVKRAMMALLNEQKSALIHRAVTRGVAGDVELKDSGLPWLGQVPKHWGIYRLKQLTKIDRGKFTHRPRNDPAFYDGEYPFIQTGAVARADKYVTSYKQTLNEKGLAVSKLFPKGTLALTIAANIGDVAILDFDCCFPDSVIGLKPRDFVDHDFLFYVLRDMKDRFIMDAPVNTQGNLNIELVGAQPAFMPPTIAEQRAIVSYIESETAQINAALGRIGREIELIAEYRTRLVCDVVTGQWDVRDIAATLPDTIVEAPALDVDLDEENDENITLED